MAELKDRILEAYFSDATIVELRGSTKISGGTPEDNASYPTQYLHSLDVGIPPTTLRLCPGALVILLRNLDCEAGLYNGAHFLVVVYRLQRCAFALVPWRFS